MGNGLRGESNPFCKWIMCQIWANVIPLRGYYGCNRRTLNKCMCNWYCFSRATHTHTRRSSNECRSQTRAQCCIGLCSPATEWVSRRTRSLTHIHMQVSTCSEEGKNGKYFRTNVSCDMRIFIIECAIYNFLFFVVDFCVSHSLPDSFDLRPKTHLIQLIWMRWGDDESHQWPNQLIQYH